MSTMDIEHDRIRAGSYAPVTENGNTERTVKQLVMQEVMIDLEALNDCKEKMEKEGLKVKLTFPHREK